MNQWEVVQSQSGMSLQVFLKEMLGGTISAKQIKRAIDSGHCLLNQKRERFSSRLVGTGDIVQLQDPFPFKKVGRETASPLDRVLYSDDDMIAYDKSSGVLSDSKDLLEALKKRFGAVILLHRLDKETTGVLLFARNERTAKAIEALFKQRLIKKTYLAVVDGSPSQASGIIENFLGKRHAYHGQAIWGSVSEEKGMPARTHWECIEKGKEASLVRCRPETGRTHQIRVHLSGLGCPILGDYQYGSSFKCRYRPNRMLLHALEVTFHHPKDKRLITIKASLPDDFLEAAKCLLESYA